ncbi:hypothetical protein CRYUN_Cryun33cG0082200 [Craigia yunnanensis]
MVCLARMTQMTMWWLTLFWRKGKKNSTGCKPSKSEGNANGLANLLLDLLRYKENDDIGSHMPFDYADKVPRIIQFMFFFFNVNGFWILAVS